jgi:hypothetical protein
LTDNGVVEIVRCALLNVSHAIRTKWFFDCYEGDRRKRS